MGFRAEKRPEPVSAVLITDVMVNQSDWQVEKKKPSGAFSTDLFF